MFLSIHLNASDYRDHYTAVMVHKRKGRKADTEFARLCAGKISLALDHKLCRASDIPGVYPASLGALSGAIDSGCPVAVLTEAFFVDAYGSNAVVEGKCILAAKAIADSVMVWFTDRA